MRGWRLLSCQLGALLFELLAHGSQLRGKRLGGRHHGRHRFGVVCQFLFSHEPTSLFRVAALRLGIADAVVLLADLFQQISILCRQIAKKTDNGLLVRSQPIQVFTVAHRLCHRLK